MKPLISTLLIAFSLASPIAFGQSFNIDVHQSGGPTCLGGVPPPSASYRAASELDGFWNDTILTSGVGVPLLDLDGQSSSAVITFNNAQPLAGFCIDNPAVGGDDAALLEDGKTFLDFSSTLISGLEAGKYSVYVYAWDPNETLLMQVSSFGSIGGPGPLALIGGAWTGAHAQGVTYALHSVTLLPGENLVIAVTGAGAKNQTGFLNGIQVVQRIGTNMFASLPATAPSTGAPNVISAIGSTSIATNHLTVLANGMPNSTGQFALSMTTGNFAFGSCSRLYLANPITRIAPVGTDPTGRFRSTLDFTAPPLSGAGIQPGQTWNFQAFSRDSGCTAIASNALAVTLTP